MYLIDKEQNRIERLDEKSFSELGFRERDHLQEWLANNPEALGEEILLIQKEFSGFDDTNERLDLLGIDKQGNLIIIENKLDDSGKDVTGQVLKYVSFCSSLTKEQIKDIYQDYLDKQGIIEKAEDNLTDFLNISDFEELSLNSGQTQRIMIIARYFRKEVTSPILWLMNYKLRIQCFKVTVFQYKEQLFLDIEQIIPMKDAEEYLIKIADKNQEDINTQEELKSRHFLRIEFWKLFLKKASDKIPSFQNISPSKDNWIGIGSGLSGVAFNSVISDYYARAEVYISRASKEENKLIFKILFDNKTEIEAKFGNRLIWEELPDKKACRIKYEINDVTYFNKEDWGKMINFLIENMIKIEQVFRDPILKLRHKLKHR
jgi:hypothetical protein